MTKEEALVLLRLRVAEIDSPELQEICEGVIADHEFLAAPASRDKHHSYEGGLVVHTAEVMEKALTGVVYDDLREVLIVAALFHDYMKKRCYRRVTDDRGASYEYTPYAKLISHVAGSYAYFYHAARDAGLSFDFIDKVGHVLLSHHGRMNWGSPVEPETEPALILHMADMWSSRLGPGK